MFLSVDPGIALGLMVFVRVRVRVRVFKVKDTVSAKWGSSGSHIGFMPGSGLGLGLRLYGTGRAVA